MSDLDFSMDGVRNGPVNTNFTPAPPVVFSSPPETTVLPAAPVPVVEAPVVPAPVVEEVTPVVEEKTLSDIKSDEVIPEASEATEEAPALSEEELVEKALLELESREAIIAERDATIAERDATIASQLVEIEALKNTADARRKKLESIILHGKGVLSSSGSSTRPAETSSAVQYNNPTTSTGELDLLMN